MSALSIFFRKTVRNDEQFLKFKVPPGGKPASHKINLSNRTTSGFTKRKTPTNHNTTA